MALLTVDQIKQYMRIEHALDDDLLDQLRTEGLALIETYVGRPILSETAGGADRTFSTVTVAGALAITSLRFGSATTTAVAWPGAAASASAVPTPFDQHPDYAARVEPVVSAALRDVVGDFYQRRNAAASYESAGGGLSVTYAPTSTGLPERVKAVLAPLRTMTF